MSRPIHIGIWVAALALITAPIIAASFSPLLQWRQPIYIIAGFSGIIGFGLLLVQPLLAGRYLTGLSPILARKIHKWVGAGLVTLVLVHVAGLWITSPPDVIDAFLFRSPTAFTPWGVIAFFCTVASATVALWRKKIGPRLWKSVHLTLAASVIIGTVAHAFLIDGTMEPITKGLLSLAVVVAIGKLIYDQINRKA